MFTQLIVASSFVIALSVSPLYAEESGTLGGTGETGANERQGAAQAQPGDRRNTTMGRDQEQEQDSEMGAVDEQSDDSRGGTRHGDAPARNPATR
jgi:hypothetical protein